MADLYHPLGYFGLVLQVPSQALLIERLASLRSPCAHHCLVVGETDQATDLPSAFGPTDVGHDFMLRVTGHAISIGGSSEVVAVELLDENGKPSGLPFSAHGRPHIIVATNGADDALAKASEAGLEFEECEELLLTCTLMHVSVQEDSFRIHPEIFLAGDEVLRNTSTPFEINEILHQDTHHLIARMRRIMDESSGVGIAAPQIGISKSLICVELKPVATTFYDPRQFEAMERDFFPFTAMFNPVILESSQEQRVFFENCLSAPAYLGAVPRSRFVTVEYLDHEGKRQVIAAKGWLARIFQHEIDHLNGYLCLDRMLPRSLVSKASFRHCWSKLAVSEVLDRFHVPIDKATEHSNSSDRALFGFN